MRRDDLFLMFSAGKKFAKKGVEPGRKGIERVKEIREQLRPPQEGSSLFLKDLGELSIEKIFDF